MEGIVATLIEFPRTEIEACAKAPLGGGKQITPLLTTSYVMDAQLPPLTSWKSLSDAVPV